MNKSPDANRSWIATAIGIAWLLGGVVAFAVIEGFLRWVAGTR